MGEFMGIGPWLQLFRAQTAPATVFTILVPYLLAGGRDPLVIILIIILGTVMHYFSFGHNSVMDYWYDIHDPNKQHHPLIKGIISFESANKVIHYGLSITLLLAVLFTIYVSPVPAIALFFLMSYVAFGHAYNDGLDKNTSHSWISISLCFTSLTLYGWFLGTSSFNIITLLVALWAFLTIFYQIAWEGNLKDLWNPAEKHNLLRRIGITIWDGRIVYVRPGAYRLSFAMLSLRIFVNPIIILLMALFLIVTYSPTILDQILFAVVFLTLTVLESIFVYRIHVVREDRYMLLEYFGKAEAIVFFQFMTLLYLVGLGYMFIILVLYGIVYFVLMNKFLWGSRFGPKV